MIYFCQNKINFKLDFNFYCIIVHAFIFFQILVFQRRWVDKVCKITKDEKGHIKIYDLVITKKDLLYSN